MCRAYQDLGPPPEASNLTVLRTAIQRLHPDTLAVRSWRAARITSATACGPAAYVWAW